MPNLDPETACVYPNVVYEVYMCYSEDYDALKRLTGREYQQFINGQRCAGCLICVFRN